MKEVSLPRIFRFALAPLSLGACTGGTDGPDSATYVDYTDYTGETIYETEQFAFDEVTPLGFSAAEALAAIAGPFQETLTWTTGASTGLELSFAVDGAPTATFLTTGYASAPDRSLSFEAMFSFRTDDGTFDEVWTVEPVFFSLETVGFHHDFDPAALVGSYEHAPCNPPACTDPTAFVTFGFDGVSTGGNLHFYGRPEDTSDDWGSIDLGAANWGWGQ